MLIHVLDCWRSSPNYAVSLADEFAFDKKKRQSVAIVDMSRAYGISMLARGMAGMAAPTDMNARLPWLEKRISEDHLQSFARTRATNTPVFCGIQDWHAANAKGSLTNGAGRALAKTDSAGIRPWYEMFGMNLAVLEARFDIVIVMSEFVRTDVVYACLSMADLILIFGENGAEVERATGDLGSSTLAGKTILCLDTRVRSTFLSQREVKNVFRDYTYEEITEYIRSLLPDYAEPATARIMNRLTA